MKTVYCLLFSATLLQACGNSTSQQPADTKEPATSKNEILAPDTKKTSPGRFINKDAGFKINGTEAFRAFDRSDKPGAQLNAVNDNLTITMHGDIAEGVLQGMLNIRSMPFKKEAGEVVNATAQYVRYFDERGGKSISYRTLNGNKFILTLTKCEKLPDGPVGEEWLLSGIFSGKLSVGVYEEKQAEEYGTNKELNFTDGKFENLKMVVLGKKK